MYLFVISGWSCQRLPVFLMDDLVVWSVWSSLVVCRSDALVVWLVWTVWFQNLQSDIRCFQTVKPCQTISDHFRLISLLSTVRTIVTLPMNGRQCSVSQQRVQCFWLTKHTEMSQSHCFGTWTMQKTISILFLLFFLPHSIYFAFRLTQDLLVHHGCSVLKSSPRTRKKPATEPDCNQFGLDCSCSPEGFEISPVAVAEAWVKLKDWLWTSCNQSSEGPVAGLGLVINYSTIPCFEHFKGVLEMHKTWVLDMHA